MNATFGWDDNTLALMLLSRPGVGRKTANQLLRLLHRQVGVGEWRALLGRDTTVLTRKPWGLPPMAAEILRDADPAEVVKLDQTLQTLSEQGIRAITPLHSHYPETLKARLGDDMPPVLFWRGALELARGERLGAVVGARQPTGPGRTMARKCAETLAAVDAVVVSGGAAGVDSAAHQAVLAAGGHTIIILPEGLGQYTLPAAWRDAFQEGRGLLLSETPPYAAWSTPAAVARNRIIAALSQVVCVIEPRKTGGSMATAGHAVSFDLPVFCYKPEPLPGGLRAAVQPITPAAAAAWDALRHAATQPPPAGPARQAELFEDA